MSSTPTLVFLCNSKNFMLGRFFFFLNLLVKLGSSFVMQLCFSQLSVKNSLFRLWFSFRLAPHVLHLASCRWLAPDLQHWLAAWPTWWKEGEKEVIRSGGLFIACFFFFKECSTTLTRHSPWCPFSSEALSSICCCLSFWKMCKYFIQILLIWSVVLQRSPFHSIRSYVYCKSFSIHGAVDTQTAILDQRKVFITPPDIPTVLTCPSLLQPHHVTSQSPPRHM